MTEIEMAGHFDSLIARGCIEHRGNLIYALTPHGETICERWRSCQAEAGAEAAGNGEVSPDAAL